MSHLRPGDKVDLLGPLGRPFTIEPQKKLALLVAGGVGLPPMIFWAQKLCSSGVETVALCGARSRNLLPLEIDSSANFSTTGEEAVLGAAEFSRCNAKLIVSTDDGSLGHHGFVTGALENYVSHRAIRADEVRVYTCGPEPMMRGVAKLCERWGFDCQLCMERSMACGMGTCQSCVVPVRDESAADGWRYKLCCTDGPIFERSELIWN